MLPVDPSIPLQWSVRSKLDDRRLMLERASAGGKSELRRAVRRVTPGQGNLKESGTENIPPAFARFACYGAAGSHKGPARRSPKGEGG